MKRRIFAWMTVFCLIMPNMNSFVFAEKETEEPVTTEESLQEETEQNETVEEAAENEETSGDPVSESEDETIQKEITLDYNGGGIDGENQSVVKAEPGQIIYESSLSVPSYPNETKQFCGWSLEKDSFINAFEETDDHSESDKVYTVRDDVTLFAYWAEPVKVTFHTGEQGYFSLYNEETDKYEETEEYSVSVLQGMHLEDSPETVKTEDDAAFVGWSFSEDGSGEVFNNEQLVEIQVFDQDTDLYAAYGNTATIILDYCGATDSAGRTRKTITKSPGTYLYEYELPALQLSDSNKKFVGWSFSNDEYEDPFEWYMVDSDSYHDRIYIEDNVTLYAYWAETYTVTFHAGSGHLMRGYDSTYGECYSDTITISLNKGDHLNPYDFRDPENTSRAIFRGWSQNSNGSGEIFTAYQIGQIFTVTQDMDFYAVYSPPKTIKLDYNGGKDQNGRTQYSITENYNNKILVEDLPEVTPPDQNHYFAGWSYSKNSFENAVVESYEDSLSIDILYVKNYSVIYAFFKEYKDLYLNTEYVKAYDGIQDVYRFTPSSTGVYYFKAVSDNPAGVVIYDQNWNKIMSGEDAVSISDYNGFDFSVRLTGNKKYIIVIEPYDTIMDEQFTFTVTANNTVKTERVSPTCEQEGNIEYWTDNTTGYIYADEACTNRISKQDTILPATGHNLLKTEAKEATFTSTGNTEYWTCTRCGRYYSDRYGYTEIAKDSWIIPMLTQPVPTRISISSGSAADLRTNYKRKISYSILPNGANTSVKWKSSDSTIAYVDSAGYLIARTYGKVTITATSAVAPTVSASFTVQTRFYDVNDSTQSYYKPVYWGADNGVVAGYNGGVYFGPDNVCTRAQFVTFLWRLAGRPTGNKNVSFKDISTSVNYYNAVKWAVSEGIIVGYKDDNTFRPDNEVTRGQVATMLWRYAGRKTPTLPSTSPFSDIDASNSSYRAVVWGQKAGVIKGYKDGSFQPDASCLRQHIVTFLYRYARDVMKQDVN